MSVSSAVLQILSRMLDASQEYVDLLNGAVPRAAHELAAMASDYSLYMQRAGLSGPRLLGLDKQLQASSAALNRTQFDLQQQLRDDVYALRLLQDVVLSAAQESLSTVEAQRIAVDTYSADMERAHQHLGSTLGTLTVQLRILANNIEIAAAHAGSSEASPQVDLFCTLAGLLRGIAQRLRSATDDLRIFEQTQSGHAEALRQVLTREGQEAMI